MLETIKIASIVEGHGEVQALPVILRRTIPLVYPDLFFEITQPIRLPRGKFDKENEFRKSVQLASLKAGPRGVVIILLDADDDCPAKKGPVLLKRATDILPERMIKVVLANREFESWYLAAASSLAGQRGLPVDLETPENSEDIRDAKGWLAGKMPERRSYSPTVDQPAFAALFNIKEAEGKSDSFAKFMRDLRSIGECFLQNRAKIP